MSACACGNAGPKYPELQEILARHAGEKGALIPILQEVQAAYGFISEDVIKEISLALDIPATTIYGVATFYAQFHLKPRGRHVVRVCQGTACHVRGGAKILAEVQKELAIKPGETTKDLRFSLEPVACLGCCGLAPVMMVDEDTHGRMTPDKVAGVLARYE
ncbi:MAG TPA: NADH-quinone oxidoreductase subunit NuoE [Firmicutes bacterium]|mgnify:CR=1|uniref:NADH-quinone oxidoreductase subunit NuoE n=1 Tax=Gelria sp. Kuro-4 TaxID=2796927 RepID=UPI0019B18E51|nr:NADH-quinone oxidoreductase subunit NuoE [Gelria sp. Kuro-4]MDI3522175.1 NADH-quinone oxidoreductase subunit [Bacillota bacterium]BCV25800.1 NADH-quinone oxidoreductase subunit E [Gelria sp. Kuro-4]HHV57421.1 NADH-quinone oxidoreductase subunit NuoE [Bacillota bacterium]